MATKKIFTWIKKNIKLRDIIYWVFIALIIILLSISIRKCTTNSDKYKNNIHALTDTIAYYQSENGALVASKAAFESNIEELKIANSNLYNELKDMKVKTSKVATAVNVQGEIIYEPQDTIYVVEKDSIGNFTQHFDFSNKWRTLNGDIMFRYPDSLGMSIDNDRVMFDYTMAIDKDNKIYIKSNNPYVTYNELSGFVLPTPKQTHFSIGPSIGIGYGVFNKKPDLFIGITASWKFFEF